MDGRKPHTFFSGKTESLDVKNSKWKIGQREEEDLEINDSDVNCGQISGEVTSWTDGGGTGQPTG